LFNFEGPEKGLQGNEGIRTSGGKLHVQLNMGV